MKRRPHKNQMPGAAAPRRGPHRSGADGERVGERKRQSGGASGSGLVQLLEIEKPIYGGAFLGRAEGKAVFVPLALPGERARVRVVEERRGYATAEIEERLTAAPERVPATCPYFGACGGCQYQHANYDAQLRFKQAILRETLERGGVRAPREVEVLAGEPWAYRNRIRLAFDGAGNPGYRGRRSHDLIAIAECPIAAPVLVKAALEFARITRQLAPALKAKEIALFCDAEEAALLVSVLCASPAKIRLDEMAQELREAIPALRGMELVTEDGAHHEARIFAQWGEESLNYRAAGVEYRVDNGAFFQVNRWLVDALVERVTAGRGGALAWDLFAGVGLFARQLAAGFDRVVAVESAPAAIDALAHNLSGTGATAVRSSTLDFLRRPAKAERPDLIVPDLIVIDPPRTGLGAETTTLLGQIAAPAIVYVSCDPATLTRDLRALIASGYEIERVTVADLFPQTFHLETIVDLRRL
jgi:23S rRNA (uracil1939-C5)-methyltransferase